jgi:carbon storage regulator
MLVLSRHKDESIVLTGGIEVMVVGIRGDTVRLGFNVPDDVVIARKELLMGMGVDAFIRKPSAATEQARQFTKKDENQVERT